EPFRCDDHLLLAAPDEKLSVRTNFANIAGMKPTVFKSPCGLDFGVEVAGGDVFAADEDFTVRGGLHFYATDGLANRTAPGTEGMIQGDDWRRLGKPVPLDHSKAQLSPERLEPGVERRGPNHECPELQPEQAMDAPVPPPAARHALLGTGRTRLRYDTTYVLAQHVQGLRYRYQNGNSPAPDLADDFRRVISPYEDDGAGEHRRDEGGHGLTEHMAEWQQVQEAYWEERSAPRPILTNLALDGDDVCQDVSVGDDHALGFGGCARGEDDFGHIISADIQLGRLTMWPLKVVEPPDLRGGRRVDRLVQRG